MKYTGCVLLVILGSSLAGNLFTTFMLQLFMNSVYVSGEGGPVPGRYTSNQLLALFFAGLVGPISALAVFDSLDQIVKGSLVQPAVKKVSTAFVFFASLAYFCVGYYQWGARGGCSQCSFGITSPLHSEGKADTNHATHTHPNPPLSQSRPSTVRFHLLYR